MKTIIFILLKILEVGAAVGAYCGLAWLGNWFTVCFNDPGYGSFHIVSFGLGISLLIIAVFLIATIVFLISMIPVWIRANQRWSDSVLEWIKNR